MHRFIRERWDSFLAKDYASGIILLAAAFLALFAENSPLGAWYERLLSTVVEIRIDDLDVTKPLLLWINDGLMAVFFFQVGLEIKKEMLTGALSDRSALAFPLFAAAGGVVVPALCYFLLNSGPEGSLVGWAIPTATDIAFALGVLALLGNRVPPQLKLFLLTLAVLDDLAAVVIIAFFYTSSLSWFSLGVASAAIALLWMLNRRGGCSNLAPFVVVGLILWVSVLKSGVHATLAGVVLALFIPASHDPNGRCLLENVKDDLHDTVYFVILPVFAFANAGVNLRGLDLQQLLHPIPLGIFLGLFVGKQVGITLFAWLGVRLRLAQMPPGITWRQLHAVSVTCGIGFTMSLFISSLAFTEANVSIMVSDRLGILGGSLISGCVGYLLLRMAVPPYEQPRQVIEEWDPDAGPGSPREDPA